MGRNSDYEVILIFDSNFIKSIFTIRHIWHIWIVGALEAMHLSPVSKSGSQGNGPSTAKIYWLLSLSLMFEPGSKIMINRVKIISVI